MGQEKNRKKGTDIDYQLIESSKELVTVAQKLKSKRLVALDIEADSMYHYKEKVCLIQMATDSTHIVIDPIKVKDISPIFPILSNPKIKKILHGADYDVRSLYRDFNVSISNLFDTQIASLFLGEKETGLEAVLSGRFDVKLNKSFQKKDWSQRPLPDEMIRYASMDTCYLIPLYKIYKQELILKDRLSWVKEECECLSRVRPMCDNSDPFFMKFKGAGRLNPRNLAILENLLSYRNRAARKKDRPLFKVLSNASLLKIALDKPTTLPQLKDSSVISLKQINMYGSGIVQAVRDALALPYSQLPSYPQNKAPRLSPKAPERIKRLRLLRDKLSELHGLDPGIILSRTIINTLAEKNPKTLSSLAEIENFKRWQRKAFGKEILHTLRDNSQ